MIRWLAVLLLLAAPAWGAVVWEDNFDGFTSGWGPKTTGGATLFPWTTNENYDPTDGTDYANGGGSGISDYEPSTFSQGSRTNANSWNGWTRGDNSEIEIVTTGGRNNTPCVRFKFPKYTGLGGETGIHKWLGNVSYQELYVRYYFKFDSGTQWQWNGSITAGRPPSSLIWKLGRVWTGFNPMDYDKTGGQSQPVDDTLWTRERNWRTGIWIWRWVWPDSWGTQGTPFQSMANFYWPVSCTYPADGTCNSESPVRHATTGEIWDWGEAASENTYGQVMEFANSGNAYSTAGRAADAAAWHWIEFYVKNQSNPTAGDGDFRMWVDGVEITADASISPPIKASMSADADDYGLNFVRFNDNWNHLLTNIDASPGYQYYYIDDVVISTTGPIGAAGAAGSSSSATIGAGQTATLGAGATATVQ